MDKQGVKANFSLIVAGIILNGCGDYFVIKNNNHRNSLLDGTYRSSCIDLGAGQSLIFEEIYSGSSYQQTSYFYTDVGAGTCEDSALLIKRETSGSFTRGADYTSSVLNGATQAFEMDYVVGSVQLTTYNNGTTNGATWADTNLLGPDCSTIANPWVNGVGVDVAGSNCGLGGDAIPSSGQAIYSFIDLNSAASPAELIFGDIIAGGNQDGTIPQNRPLNKTDVKLFKQ